MTVGGLFASCPRLVYFSLLVRIDYLSTGRPGYRRAVDANPPALREPARALHRRSLHSHVISAICSGVSGGPIAGSSLNVRPTKLHVSAASAAAVAAVIQPGGPSSASADDVSSPPPLVDVLLDCERIRSSDVSPRDWFFSRRRRIASSASRSSRSTFAIDFPSGCGIRTLSAKEEGKERKKEHAE